MKYIIHVITVFCMYGCGAERIRPTEAESFGANGINGRYNNKAEYLRHYWHGREGDDGKNENAKLTDILGIKGIDESETITLSVHDDKIFVHRNDQLLLTKTCRIRQDRVELDGESKRAVYILVNMWNDKAVTLFADSSGNLLIDKSEWGGGMVLILASGIFDNWHYICRRK